MDIQTKLNPEQIDALALDDLCVEVAKAAGWKDIDEYATPIWGTGPDGRRMPVPYFPGDIAMAWHLAQEQAIGIHPVGFHIVNKTSAMADNVIIEVRAWRAFALRWGQQCMGTESPTAPEAICRVFLKVRHEVTAGAS